MAVGAVVRREPGGSETLKRLAWKFQHQPVSTLVATSTLNRIVRILSFAGAIYSLCALVWFFSIFASKVGRPLTEFSKSIVAFGTLALAPYAICWFAQYISRSRSASVVVLVIVTFSAVTSVIAYMPAFNPHQQGDFPVVFFLGVVQLVLAVVACCYGAISRWIRDSGK